MSCFLVTVSTVIMLCLSVGLPRQFCYLGVLVYTCHWVVHFPVSLLWVVRIPKSKARHHDDSDRVTFEGRVLCGDAHHETGTVSI